MKKKIKNNFTFIIRRYDSFLLFDVNSHFYDSKLKFEKMRAKKSVKI